MGVMSDSPKLVEPAGDLPRLSDSDVKRDNHGSATSMVLGGIEEKKLIRKLDVHIIPVVMILYLLSFLDR